MSGLPWLSLSLVETEKHIHEQCSFGEVVATCVTNWIFSIHNSFKSVANLHLKLDIASSEGRHHGKLTGQQQQQWKQCNQRECHCQWQSSHLGTHDDWQSHWSSPHSKLHFPQHWHNGALAKGTGKTSRGGVFEKQRKSISTRWTHLVGAFSHILQSLGKWLCAPWHQTLRPSHTNAFGTASHAVVKSSMHFMSLLHSLWFLRCFWQFPQLLISPR